jgi:hypothetical protein
MVAIMTVKGRQPMAQMASAAIGMRAASPIFSPFHQVLKMRQKEFEDRLQAMTESEFREFRSKSGQTGNSREWFFNDLLSNPSREAQYAHALGIPTEQERTTQATLSAADAAIMSAKHAEEGNKIASDSNQIARDANAQAVRANWIAALSALMAIAALVISLIK